MKKLISFSLILIAITFINSFSFAASPLKTSAEKTVKIFAPVYKTVTDSGITYYRTKINDEDVLVDNKGRFIKYLCEDEEVQTHTTEIYKVIMIPVNMFRKLK